MKVTKLDDMFDERTDSRSILVSMSVTDYLELTGIAYENRGGLDGQRAALKTTAALRIRNRMREDFSKGAILPPVVVGLVVDPNYISNANTLDDAALNTFLTNIDKDTVSIIDGMQRTAIFFDNAKDFGSRQLRVEMWMAIDSSNLIYRMLVLNTGQVPWNLRRQIEVVNRSLLGEILSKTKFETSTITPRSSLLPLSHYVTFFGVDHASRRTNPCQFQSHEIVEMYIAFGLRKSRVDTETVLADQFSRLDMVDAVSEKSYFSFFVQIFVCMIRLDYVFSQYKPSEKSGKSGSEEAFVDGRNLFDSHPACIGFFVAAAQKLYGRPGTSNKEAREQLSTLSKIRKRCQGVAEKFESLSDDDMGQYLDFTTLNELLQRPVGKHGVFQRELFTEAFRVLLSSDDDLTSLTPCWRAS